MVCANTFLGKHGNFRTCTFLELKQISVKLKFGKIQHRENILLTENWNAKKMATNCSIREKRSYF